MYGISRSFDSRVIRVDRNNVNQLPNVCDVKITSKKSRINSKHLGKPEKKNKKKKYEFSEEDDELNEHFEDINLNQDVNKPDEASALANGGNEEDERDQKNVTRYLDDRCEYDFSTQTVTLKMGSEFGPWGIVKTEIFYNNKKIEDFTCESEENVKIIKFEISTIERHIFERLFRVFFKYVYHDNLAKTYETELFLDVPCFQVQSRVRFGQLPPYLPEKAIEKIHRNEFRPGDDFSAEELNLLAKLERFSRMTPHERDANPAERMEMLGYAQDIECLSLDYSMAEFEMKGVTIGKDQRSGYFFVRINTELKFPETFRDLSLSLSPTGHTSNVKIDDKNEQNQVKAPRRRANFIGSDGGIYVAIQKCMDGCIFFEETQDVNIRLTYNIKFVSNRVTSRTTQNALKLMDDHGLRRFFQTFDANVGVAYKLQLMGVEQKVAFEWENPKVAENVEQMTAVLNIVNCAAYPSPHVIFGPPGTGKTSTLVEAVVQIIKTRPNSHILISAQSNSACDEIGVRLLRSLPKSKIFRFYSPSIGSKFNDAELKSTSNMRNDRNEYPTYEEFYHFNVVIATLVTTGRLVQMNFKVDHFQYIFIDECAASTEPEAFIPILGLVTEHNQVHANLVFLGDHKQLGPILESEYASGLGLGVSLMERIMTLPKYTANPEFDPKYVTQLLDNYRSHAAILQFPNVQFYEGKLRARADPEIVDSACQWRMLPKKNFPIILHSVLANCNQEKAGFSFYNMTEVKEVKAYVNQLLINGINGKQILPDDIGIVSPYKAQRSKLKDAFKNFPGIEIGTAEYYQGREKMIIIITTVRSGKSIGFLKDEKRLNVALTRAMCLMILVCNPVTLQKDEMWRSFIEYCDRNNAIVGHIFDVKATAGGLCAPEEYVDSFDNFAEN